MAFMSLMVMWAVFGVVLTGLVILIVGIVLLIVWKVKERKARPVKKRHKILAAIASTWEARTGWARIVVRLLGQAGTQLGRRIRLLLS